MNDLLILNEDGIVDFSDRVIGFICRTGRPSFEDLVEYRFARIDPSMQTDFLAWRIAVVEALASSLVSEVREARTLLGEECHIIALCRRSEGFRERDAMEAGADEVLCDPSQTEILSALHRAERFALRLDRMELRLREAQLTRAAGQAALDHLPTPIFFKDREGVYTWCNRPFEGVLGRSAQDIIGRSVFEISPPDLAQIYYEADEALMQAGGVQQYEADVKYADGVIRRVSFYKAAIEDPVSGRVVGLAGAMLDISERVELAARLQEAAERDPLTGAFNRRKFFEIAAEAEAQSIAGGAPFCAMVLDVDHFKKINDTHGHACGDTILCELSAILAEGASEGEVIARAGGEEFYCLIRGEELAASLEVSERLRETIAAHAFFFEGEQVPITVSIGVSEHRPGEPVNETIRRADKALYAAKKAGRNKVCAA